MKPPKGEWAGAQYVDSFTLGELVFPQASVIGLALSDSSETAGKPGHRDAPFRFRLSADRARALAGLLLEAADKIDGTGARRQ